MSLLVLLQRRASLVERRSLCQCACASCWGYYWFNLVFLILLYRAHALRKRTQTTTHARTINNVRRKCLEGDKKGGRNEEGLFSISPPLPSPQMVSEVVRRKFSLFFVIVASLPPPPRVGHQTKTGKKTNFEFSFF